MFIILFITLGNVYSKKFDLIEELTLDKLNHVKLIDVIETSMANEVISNIFKMDNDFYIYIDSDGGDVESGMKIVKMMKYIQSDNIKIKCIAKKAFSMAFHIFQRCDERLFVPNAVLMQHEMTVYISGNVYTSQKYLAKFIKLNDEINTYESNRLNMDKNLFLSELAKELWFTGDDIIEYNAGDRKVILH